MGKPSLWVRAGVVSAFRVAGSIRSSMGTSNEGRRDSVSRRGNQSSSRATEPDCKKARRIKEVTKEDEFQFVTLNLFQGPKGGVSYARI
jgi:hypothetical protein